MKNFVKLFGIMALVAVIGFSMIACDDDDNGSIVGTWTGSFNDDGTTIAITVVVKEDGTGTITQSAGSSTYSYPITWTQSGKTVTFTDDEDDTSSFTYNGGNSFTFEGVTFKRQ